MPVHGGRSEERGRWRYMGPRRAATHASVVKTCVCRMQLPSEVASLTFIPKSARSYFIPTFFTLRME